MPTQRDFRLPLDFADCPEEWQPDDLSQALPRTLRQNVSYLPKNDDGQPRWTCEDQDEAPTVARMICKYLGAPDTAPEIDGE